MVLSRTPSCSSPSTSLPTCASVCSTNPANTSINRRWNGRSDSGMLSHEAGSCRARRQLRVGRNPAEFLLPLENTLAVLVPAVVELAFVLVGPLREDVVRAVACPGRPVHQERLVGRERLVPLDPGEPLVDHVFGQVVFLAVRRLDGVEVFVRAGVPTATFRRPGSRRSSRTRGRWASGRTGPSRWSGWPGCCATSRTPPTCSRSGAASRRWWPKVLG